MIYRSSIAAASVAAFVVTVGGAQAVTVPATAPPGGQAETKVAVLFASPDPGELVDLTLDVCLHGHDPVSGEVTYTLEARQPGVSPPSGNCTANEVPDPPDSTDRRADAQAAWEKNRPGNDETPQLGLVNLKNTDVMTNVNAVLGVCENNINVLGVQVPLQDVTNGVGVPLLSPGEKEADGDTLDSCAGGGVIGESSDLDYPKPTTQSGR